MILPLRTYSRSTRRSSQTSARKCSISWQLAWQSSSLGLKPLSTPIVHSTVEAVDCCLLSPIPDGLPRGSDARRRLGAGRSTLTIPCSYPCPPESTTKALGPQTSWEPPGGRPQLLHKPVASRQCTTPAAALLRPALHFATAEYNRSSSRAYCRSEQAAMPIAERTRPGGRRFSETSCKPTHVQVG